MSAVANEKEGKLKKHYGDDFWEEEDPVGRRARAGRRNVIGPLPTMAWLIAEFPTGD